MRTIWHSAGRAIAAGRLEAEPARRDDSQPTGRLPPRGTGRKKSGINDARAERPKLRESRAGHDDARSVPEIPHPRQQDRARTEPSSPTIEAQEGLPMRTRVRHPLQPVRRAKCTEERLNVCSSKRA